MNATDILKFLHVLSAIVWVGGGFMLQVLLARSRKLGPDSMNQFTQAAEWTSNRIFMPASFAALISGIATTVVGSYDWGAPWIGIGFAGFLVSAIIGMAVLGPTSKKLKELGPQRGPNDPVVTHLARRIDRAGKIDLVVLVAVVFVMVVKP
ncbi:MAG: DUF2269 family protein [Actinomycetota bacterium]